MCILYIYIRGTFPRGVTLIKQPLFLFNQYGTGYHSFTQEVTKSQNDLPLN